MKVDFTKLEMTYLRQIKGYADIKSREAGRAMEAAQEAQGLFQEYLALLSRIHEVEGKNLTLRQDFSGFDVALPQTAVIDMENGRTVV